MRIEIRRVRAEEGSALMQVRLSALLDAPYAFGATYTDSIQRPGDEWAARAAASSAGGSEAIFLAHAPDGVVGMAGGFTPTDRRLVRILWGVWVEPALRGQGLGRRLVDSVLDWAAIAGADRIELWVAEPNAPALRMYQSMGFEDTADRQPLLSDRTVTERRLVRRAGREPSA
jgi:GNAT superfamily N-acetyltransferase